MSGWNSFSKRRRRCFRCPICGRRFLIRVRCRRCGCCACCCKCTKGFRS